VALLAFVNASMAELVNFNPAFFIYENAHFEPFLFAHAWHSNTPLKKYVD
jgi:hypothetical protein